MKSILAAIAIAVSGTAPAQTGADESAILQVMQKFDAALRARNVEGMKSLFYNGEIVWKNTARPEIRKVETEQIGKTIPTVYPSGAIDLFKNERIRHVPIAERFYDPKIITDGQLASLTFAYDFTFNCKATNWGMENWQMVKVDGAWRILNLLYSYENPGSALMPARHALPVPGCVPVKLPPK